MEDPAHVFTTGIPMSQKGNSSQNKHGCDKGETFVDISIPTINDHDYQNSSHLVLTDSTPGNSEYIANSIQNGFQSEILCDFVTDVGLPSNDIRLENGLEVESIPDTQIKFPVSPESPFPIKICSFNSIENFVPCLDEHLENYLLPDFKSENKSDDVDQYSEEENRTVTEAISAIAKSFGLENLLPESFQNDPSYETTTNGLCSEDDNNIGDLSLGDFDKCTALHSPASSLDLADQLSEEVQAFELSNLEMLTSHVTDNQDLEPPQIAIKEDPSYFINPKEDCSPLVDEKLADKLINSNTERIFAVNNLNDVYNFGVTPSETQTALSSISEANVQKEMDCDVPLMQIPDIQEPTEVRENCPTGTVLITRDKNSNKMQIVLTLDQGQQVYDIDTENIDVNEHALGLELQNALNEHPVQTANVNALKIPDISSGAVEEISTNLLSESIIRAEEEEEAFFEPTAFMQLIGNVPVTVTKACKKKVFNCPVDGCGQVFDKECKLRVHMFSHNDSARPFKCNVEGCDWAFTTPYRLRRHVETHLGSKEYICDFEGCNRKFTTVYNLKTHLKSHKWPNSLTCPAADCQLSFSNRRKLELHLRIHKEVEAPYKCSLCGKQYYSANCIASHLRTHQYNEDDFKCPFQGCGKIYDKICRLKQHIRHHTGDRPYICPAEGCKWSFMSASKLTRHMRKHTGERKFVCTEPGCGKSFMRPEHLKGHVVIHSGDKPFHCPHENCNARFTAKSSLYVHVKKHCPSILKVVYPCPIDSCVKKYNSKATLKQHLVKFHPELVGDGKELNIAEKLELTMPVSLVSQSSDDAARFLELEDNVVDDPSSDLKTQLLDSSVSATNSSSVSNKPVPKQSKPPRSQNKNKVTIKLASNRNSLIELKRSQSNSRFVKLFQKTKNGAARTDIYCTYLTESKNNEPPPSPLFLNHNSDTQCEDNYLSNQLSTEIKSPDIMLASSIILHDQTSDQFLKSNFLADDCSNGLYHDDSLLMGSSAFETGLIPVSLLSDSVESEESVLIDSSSVIFSEQNSVDAFIEPISLQGLD